MNTEMSYYVAREVVREVERRSRRPERLAQLELRRRRGDAVVPESRA